MTIVEVLQQEPEPLPGWLQESTPFDRAAFFGSRTVFYPGWGDDGHPVSICARAHAAHAFVYTDYMVSRQDISDRIHNRIKIPGRRAVTGFKGYDVEREEDVNQRELYFLRHSPRRLRPPDEVLRRDENSFLKVKPFALYVVLKRDDDHDDSHGPERFAVLFVGSDGYVTYHALYGQIDGTPPPFLVLVQDHGLGGNYDRFGGGGLLERIAHRCSVRPKWLLVAENSEPWAGYQDTGAESECGGMHRHPRRLYFRE